MFLPSHGHIPIETIMRNGKKVENVLIIYGNVRLLVYTTKVKSTAGESRFHDFAKRKDT